MLVSVLEHLHGNIVPMRHTLNPLDVQRGKHSSEALRVIVDRCLQRTDVSTLTPKNAPQITFVSSCSASIIETESRLNMTEVICFEGQQWNSQSQFMLDVELLF